MENFLLALSNLTLLCKLRLNDNGLDGNMSPRLGNLKKMAVMNLSNKKLNGSIPKELFSSQYVCKLVKFSYNFLVGPLPLGVGSFKNIEALSFSSKKLSGTIPRTLSNCVVMQHLSLNGKFFKGEIPSSHSNIKGLLELDLSNNNLSGVIPKELEQISDLVYLNLSLNSLHGRVPANGVFAIISSGLLHGNVGLWGGSTKLQLPACTMNKSRQKKKLSVFIAEIPVIVIVS